MKTQDLIALFGTLELVGREVGVSKSAVSQWGEFVPPLRVYQFREKHPDIDRRIAALQKYRKSSAAGSGVKGTDEKDKALTA
jgi:hypothetical protein